MTKAFSALLAGAAMLALSGVAQAQQPMQLTDSQLDHVTAGASALGVFAGAAFGSAISGVTATVTTAVLGANAAASGNVLSFAGSLNNSGAVAASGLQLTLTSP